MGGIKMGLIYVLAGASMFFLGMLANSRMQRDIKLECPECPDLRCPPNVSVNSLNLEELKKMKIRGGFVYSPVYNGDVVQNNCDSLR